MNFVLAIDPGAKPGYCLAQINPFQIVSVIKPLDLPPGTVVVVEMPEIRKTKLTRTTIGKIDPQSVVKLAFTAGQQFAEMKALPGCIHAEAFPPSVWKERLYRGGGTLKKAVFCERVRVDLKLDPSLTQDQLDAAGLAWAFVRGLS